MDAASAPAARAAEPGKGFPPGFPMIVDHSLGKPVIGFGGSGRGRHVPVAFLHGNNETPYETGCNTGFGHIHVPDGVADWADVLEIDGDRPADTITQAIVEQLRA